MQRSGSMYSHIPAGNDPCENAFWLKVRHNGTGFRHIPAFKLFKIETMADESIISGKDININNKERVISLLGGTWLLFRALSGRKNVTQALAAGYLVFRGTTGYCPLYLSLDMDTTEAPSEIHVKSTVVVNRPRAQVYATWRKLENLPGFLKHLKNVKELDDKQSLWSAKIPGGVGTIAWKSEIVSEVQDEYIAWKSLEGSQIDNVGQVVFRDAGHDVTAIDVEIGYRAPAGNIGEMVAKLLNPLLEKTIHDDISQFKTYIEAGEWKVVHQNVSVH